MTRPEPAWLSVACPKCKALPGEECWIDKAWLVVAARPHAARKRAAEQVNPR